MHAILAAILAVAPLAPATTSPTVPASRPSVALPATAAVTPLPGAPRSVTLTRTSEGNVLTWQPPSSSGDSPISGYVVLAGEKVTIVGADVTRVIVTADSGVAVATLNGVGSSVAAKAKVAIASRGARRAAR